MSTFKLDDIRAAAEKKYGSFDIELGDGEVVRLLNPLKLSKGKRKELEEIQGRESSDADAEESLFDTLEIISETEAQYLKLVEAVGDDLTVVAEIMEEYAKSTELGEASPSHD